ncbi:hypothetical protein LCI18_013246 [Fusarium solani-melongenae]|uniref:Uncharacterized protein n=1 Tax=Fusarium solani subsp. cucurbitae TaxID=2747967 RepID=A0ACD3ZM70_FUSSC|nr:hypothetical protein LCI18_013246 [Fusarium solani-melongenae]
MNTTNTLTLLEDLQGLQGEPFGERLTTNTFWILLFLILINLVWTLCQLAELVFCKSVYCSTHNSDPASEDNNEPTQRDFIFLLLAQLVEGYLVTRLFAGITVIRFTEWSEATSHFDPPVLRYIFNVPAIAFLLITWIGILSLGAVILDIQWRYTKELLMLKIKGQNRGNYQGRQCAAETGNWGNSSEFDLECGLFMLDKEVPENLFGTT